MKKTYSAKLAALMLAITIFCTLLAACKPGGKVDGEKDENKVKTEESSEKEDSLRVLVDLGLCNTQISTDQERDKTLKQFKQEIKELGGPKDIEFEYIFYDYRSERKSENAMLRDSELTRVRTEILAGAGPDVFIVACDNHAGSVREDALLDDRLMSLLNNSVRYVDNPETLEKEVHRAYIEMQMMLGES